MLRHGVPDVLERRWAEYGLEDHSPGVRKPVMINLFINFIGTLPTISKSWSHPESERKVAWSLFSLGTMCVAGWNWFPKVQSGLRSRKA